MQGKFELQQKEWYNNPNKIILKGEASVLNIFYGRENLNKDKFIFDSIKGQTLLLVPDQFTLQAERDALFYMKAKGLMDIEVVSISRLGTKVLAETGGGHHAMINQYGRHMLLAKIMKEHRNELGLYSGMEKKQSFIEMVNDFISELKQYGVDSNSLQEVIDGLTEQTFMKRKLQEIKLIFECYEEQIQGKYIDNEDHVSIYASKISQSQKIRDSEIWIYGFDLFTPKNTEVIQELIRSAQNVNIVLTGSKPKRDAELFQLFQYTIKKFETIAGEVGQPYHIEQIPDQYINKEKRQGILDLEKELYSLPIQSKSEHEGITIVQAANFYSEAETAAAKVLSLVRDQGMKYNEIILICNDLETRGTIIKRVFHQYGMELFLDKKQGILHNPASIFLISLMELAEGDYSTESIFRLLKTELTDMEWSMVEQMENYARKYRIHGKRWTKPFQKGAHEYEPEELQRLEQARSCLIEQITAFIETFQKGATVKEQVQILYNFLVDDCKLPEKLEALIEKQEARGYLSAAAETAQIWGLLMDVLDQFVEIVGEEEILTENFSDILRTGMESIEVGLLPPSADGLIMGTMQRTRSSHVKAMIVIGANEGLIPAAPENNSILSEDEKKSLAEQHIEICKVDAIRQQEEKMAIYKNLSKPSDELWISYSVSDVDGKELKASQILTSIKEIYPSLEEQRDLITEGKPQLLLQAKNAGKDHLLSALREVVAGKNLADEWNTALSWYKEKKELEKMQQGLFYTGEQEQIRKEFIHKLYRNDFERLIMSPSKLEKYSRCPFSYFVQYGLKPDEQRVFEVGGREIGDMYHHCFMELSKWLTEDGVELQAESSRWMKVSKDECLQKVDQILNEAMQDYRDGVMGVGKEEQYRSRRLKEICGEISWVLIDHVRRGKIEKMDFEKTFGRYGNLPPITIDTEQGQVLIEGTIDRIDTLPGDYVKIIDYKTGRETFDWNEAKKGYRLQLMLYLRAAQEGKHKPAGVFYFQVREPELDGNKINKSNESKDMEKRILKEYKMNGTMVDEPEVIEAIAGDFENYSDIVPLRLSGTSGVAETSKDSLLPNITFNRFQQEFNQKTEEICRELLRGENPAKPMKGSGIDSCKFCMFKGICRFDIRFEGCNYEQI